ncbi:hypothetical protein [Bacillus sp. AFS037270]|uniref:hypothetical protein n=1 Tax=Bacillus sp. AFS037270 TaxID=2033499 RepID=UPI00159BE2C0|nr:hypothetical protein [Bacillus sp. AFS037270]
MATFRKLPSGNGRHVFHMMVKKAALEHFARKRKLKLKLLKLKNGFTMVKH